MRQEIVREYDRAAAAISAVVVGLSEEQASRPEIDGWSVNDHLRHVAIWHEMRFFEISRVARGDRPAFPVFADGRVDAVNETLAGMRRSPTLSEALADLNFARMTVLRAIADCPEERLDPKLYEEMSPPGGAAHELEHAETIAAWRAKEGI